MAILSEGKGVMMWLKNRGIDEQFSGYILKIFNQETNLSFYKITHNSFENKKFQKFTNWFGLQNKEQLYKNYKEYKAKKKENKEAFLEYYYNSHWHEFFMKNQSQTTNQLYKQFKHKIRYGEFKAFHKKSKLKFN